MVELIIANVTPFTNNRVDLDCVAAHTRWMVEAGVDGFAPTGTTGGFLYLDLAEKRALHQVVIAAAGDRKVIPCVWDARPDKAVWLAQSAEGEGAWGVFLPPPLYHVVPESVIRRWYDRIRQAVSVPVLAYHHPRTHNPLSLSLLSSLIDEQGLSGVKDSSGDPERIAALAQRWPGRVWIGGDRFLGQASALGPIAGHISGYGNGWPRQAIAAVSGQWERAQLLAAVAAVKAAGGSRAVAAALGMGARLPLDAPPAHTSLPPTRFTPPAG